MNPPLSTSFALLDTALQPFVIELGSIRSCNGVVVFMRDKHYRSDAVCIASVAPDIADKRLEFVESSIENHRVDLSCTSVGATFSSKTSKFLQSRMNPAHMVWGIYISLPNKHEAVVQLSFEKSGTLPSASALEKLWSKHRDEIVHSLEPFTKLSSQSLGDEARALPPITPNAAVVRWAIANSGQKASSRYGDLRHFLTSFKYAVKTLVDYHNGSISCEAIDGQTIIVYLPEDVDPCKIDSVRAFVQSRLLPLVTKIQRAHESLATHYQPEPCLNLVIGVDHIERSQHNDLTGPVFWRIDNKLRVLASSSDFANVVIEDESKKFFD